MPSPTYTLIASNTLTSTASSVTFSAIPQGYTDLVLKMSVRSNRANTTDTIKINFNSDTSALYSQTYLRGSGATTTSSRDSSFTYIPIQYATGDTTTTNTFSNIESYIPSYTVSQDKPLSNFSAHENNTSTAFLFVNAGLYRSTSAISSIAISLVDGPNFVSGSSFYLYGIINS